MPGSPRVSNTCCLMAGVDSLTQMMDEDVTELAGEHDGRNADKPGDRWGSTPAQRGFHGGTVAVQYPRVRNTATNDERVLPSWDELAAQGHLGQWALTLVALGVATRRFAEAVRQPRSGAPPQGPGSGLSKSAIARRFTARTPAKFEAWMGADLSGLDRVAIAIDGLHRTGGLLIIGAVGIDIDGHEHPLGILEGATGTAATGQALLDDRIARGLPDRPPPSARCAGKPGQRKLPKRRNGGCGPSRDGLTTKRRLRPARSPILVDLEGLDAILTLRLGLPPELRRSLASTNSIESMHSVGRRPCRTVKRWRDAHMALRWPATGMPDARKGFRRVKACQQLSLLREALIKQRQGRNPDTLQDAASSP